MMAKEIKLPELGENIEAADVVSVLVKAGDKIEKDQSIIEIETDKATIEVPASISGTVKDVKIKEGDSVKVGQTILTVEGSEESAGDEEKAEEKMVEKSEKDKEEDKIEENAQETKKEEKKKGSKSEGKVVEYKLPELGENIESADVINVLVKEGDTINEDEAVIEIETDKATIEVPSNVAGKIVEMMVKAGDTAKVGQVIMKVETSAEAEPTEKEEKAETKEKQKEPEKVKEEKEDKKKEFDGRREKILPGETDHQPPIRESAAPAAPSVRRIAREIGVEIRDVPGSGPGGRISMDDVKAYAKKLNEGREAGGGFGIKQEPLPDFSKFGEVERKKMSKIRSTTADHLSYAWSVIPHVTQHDKADITGLEKARKALNPKVEKAGGKLTVTSILLKILASAMKVYPQFNSSIDMENKEIIYKKYFHIGVAVDTENGLIVPVIRDVNDKNLTELSVELNSLAEKARIRKISLDELQGGCMTITNLGGIGGTQFTPIVNSPEVAILGVSRGSIESVYNRDKNSFEPRLILPLSLSYDHRIIDGADAARFLRWVCNALEQPLKILMEG